MPRLRPAGAGLRGSHRQEPVREGRWALENPLWRSGIGFAIWWMLIRKGRTNPRIRVKALRRVTWGRVLALCAPRTETKRDCRADAHGNPRWFPFRDLLCFWFLVLLQVELEASPMPWTSFLFVSLWWNLRTCQLLGVFSRGLPPGPFPFGAHKTILPQQ